jgi:glycogen debranching enzyme
VSKPGVVLAIMALLACAASAQSPTAAPRPKKLVDRFSAASGLESRVTANPARYFDAIGRKAAVFGKQDGRFEVWLWPIKVLHGFHLEFRLDNMPEAVRGEDYLQSVTVRPESTTLLYVHPQFTVKQIIFAGDDRSAMVQFLDVTSDRPLEITCKFTPDFKPMWPAALGGQHSGWLDADKAFTLSDGTGKPTAVIGSPATSANTEFMDHSLIGGEMLLRIATRPAEARHSLYPIIMTLSMNSESEAQQTYRDVLAHAREMYEKKVARWRDFLGRTLQLKTPDAQLNNAFTWAKVSIEQGWVCTAPPSAQLPGAPKPSVPPEGFAFPGNEPCGIVAGYGPAGEGERPGFAWWFGGDGLMSTWAMLDYGDFEGAVRELRFLRAHQRSDGKMMHEMVQSTGIVDWWGQYHFPYMHADTTPMYVYSLGQYWQRTGDRRWLEDFWPSAKKAYEYCVSTVDPEDGLIDNTRAGLGAIEVGVLRGKVKKDIYVQGFWIGGLRAMSALARAMGDATLAADADRRLSKALETLRTHWRDPARHYYVFGVNTEGERADLVGNWSAVLMSLGGGVGPQPSDDNAAVNIFALPELSTDWGSRGISNKSPLYDPVSYNNGTAWPYASGLVAWSQFVNDQPLAGYFTLMSLAHLTGIQAPGGMPEHMVGNRDEPGARSVPRQLFSSWSMVRPLVGGLMGFSTSVNGQGESTLRLQPRLPANWNEVQFSHFRIGAGELSGSIAQLPGKITENLELNAVSPELRIAPLLPFGATAIKREWNGHSVSTRGNELTIHSADLRGAAEVRAAFDYRGGIGIVPVTPDPERGAPNTALKVLGVVSDERAHTVTISLAGLAGHTYELRLVTTLPELQANGATVEPAEGGFRLSIPFAAGEDWVTKDVVVKY